MVIIIPVFILSLIIFIASLYHNKLTFLNIKIGNINEKIKSTLIKRKELIKESENLIKEIVNTDKQIFEGLQELSNKDISIFELDRRLLVYINEFNLIKDKYKKLQKNEEFQKVAFAINETGDLLDAYKEYYNDTAEKYNKLIKSFPVIIISFIKEKRNAFLW